MIFRDLLPTAWLPQVGRAWQRHYDLAGLYSLLYKDVSEGLADSLAGELKVPPQALRVMMREVVVSLAYLYLDRLLRVDAAISATSVTECRVPRAAPLAKYSRLETLQRQAAYSEDFSAALISHIAEIWEMRRFDIRAEPVAAISAFPPKFVNNMFNQPTFWQRLVRVLRLISMKADSPEKLVPVLSMGLSTPAFWYAGFYGTYFVSIAGTTPLIEAREDEEIRMRLSSALRLVLPNPLKRFLEGAGFPLCSKVTGDVLDNFVRFLVRVWPTSLLEGTKANLTLAVENLKQWQPGPLIVGERGDLVSLLLIAATKVLNIEAINFQHGGHIGYLIDQTTTREIEEFICNRFITWGWTDRPEYPIHHTATYITPLPVPWLCERKKFWTGTLKSNQKKQKTYDFLFFSSRMHRFPTAPSGAYQLTMDYLEEYGEFLVGLARTTGKAGYGMLHKPYNHDVANLMSRYLDAMEQVGVGHCVTADTRDKGMTKHLLAQAEIVLWDSPGTGFLECMVCGIPAMCCWPRLYNREEPHSEDVFKALEAVGVVSSTPDALVLAYQHASTVGIQAWMIESSRVAAVTEFSRRYGRTSEKWIDQWTQFLKKRSL